jgi:hypothetical protein
LAPLSFRTRREILKVFAQQCAPLWGGDMRKGILEPELRAVFRVAHAGLVLTVAGSSACCLSTIAESGDRSSSSSSSLASASAGTTGSSATTGGTSFSGTTSGGSCVQNGRACSQEATCCDNDSQCALSQNARVCCVPDGAAPISGWPGDCCSQNELDVGGGCRPASGSGSGGTSSGGTIGGGTGGLHCPAGESPCFANGQYVCTDLDIDPTNCGSCRFECGSAPYCVKGVCQASEPGGTGPKCAPGLSSCFANGAYVCTNFQADPSNCGQCRFTCDAAPYCVNGICETTASTCSLAFDPTSLNFGSVMAGTQVTMSAQLTNVGEDTCTVVGIALSSSTDPAFSLAPGQAQLLNIPAGSSGAIGVQCDLPASGSPVEHSGDVDYQSNDPQHMAGTIFLLAGP